MAFIGCIVLGCPDVLDMLKLVRSAFEFRRVTARSFRLVLVLKCFAWRQTAEVVSLSVRAQRR